MSAITDKGVAEDILLRRYAEDPSPQLLDELVRRFTPLARSLAARYRGGAEPLEDLMQVASLGLVKAIEGFDPGRGKPFTAYAVPTILGELKRYFRDGTWGMRVSRSIQERTLAVDAAVDRLTRSAGRAPSVAELAAELGIEPDQVLEAISAGEARRPLSLDAPRSIGDEETTPTIEAVGREDPGYDGVEARFASLSAGLTERERKVLALRFGEGLTQAEIGEMIGVSQMQVSRISRAALARLLESVRGGEAVGAAELEPA